MKLEMKATTTTNAIMRSTGPAETRVLAEPEKKQDRKVTSVGCTNLFY
jgi:hypothetical protein